MEPQSGPVASPLWNKLPGEIRLKILEEVALGTGGYLAPFASVNKEWQFFFEKRAFRQLTISPHCIFKFGRIVKGTRRQAIRHIRFTFERKFRGPADLFYNDCLTSRRELSENLILLLMTISGWAPEEVNPDGLALELTTFAANDPDYSIFNYASPDIDKLDVWTDSYDLWEIYEMTNIHSFPPSDMNSVRWRLSHLTCPPSDASPFITLPKIPAITELVIRRQPHSIFLTTYLKKISKALPNVRHITCETWQEKRRDPLGRNLLNSFLYLLPPTLKSLHIFEDNPYSYFKFNFPHKYTEDCCAMAQTIAQASQHMGMESLSLSYLVDAKDFFATFGSPTLVPPRSVSSPGWDSLVSLTLTSSLLEQTASAHLSQLLWAAGEAAARMPKLQIMEIFNASPGHGAIFRFYTDSGRSYIEWESTWSFELPQKVIQSWSKAAFGSTSQVIEVNVHQIPPNEIQDPSYILPYLHTRRSVVYPLTYCDIMEGNNFL